MKNRILILSALAAFGFSQAAAQTDKISSVALNGLGVVTVTERIGVVGNQAGTVGDSLAGLAYVAGDVPLDGSPNSVAFYALSVSGAAVPPTAATAFTSYGALTFPSQVDTYADVAAKLVVLSPAGSYSGLAFAADDLGFGSSFQFYMIDHRGGTDYFAQITPGTGTSSLIRDLKPMSWAAPGGVAGTPADTGLSGYFALTYASTPAASYPANSMYYLRTDASNHTQFGYMIPALTSGSFDTIDLDTATGGFGATGYSTLAWMTDAVGGNPANQFYYLRQDNGPGGTGNTILGRLNSSLVAGTRTISDIANLGGVFDTLTYTPDATGTGVGWGSTQFFVTGSLTATAQSISFPAIADRLISAGSFTVTPSASSTLPLTLTVEASSTGTATISGPVAGVFTVTPLTPGVITLQAKQSGPGVDTNWLNQSFNANGVPVINSSITASGTVGTAFAYNTTAAGSPTSYTASPLPAGVLFNTTTGVFSGTPTTAAVTTVTITATNGIGTSAPFTLTITIVAAGVAPVITNSPLTAGGTVGTAFSFTITGSNSPTSYSATPLPAGIVINTTTGVLSGTPTTAAVTSVTIGATNATGTGTAVLTVTISAAATAPVINSVLSASGVGGTPGFTYTITASGSPTSFSASVLPSGLDLNPTTGVISGTPTTAASTSVTIGATNATGTGTATLIITISAAPVTVNPAILAVLPALTAPVANWSDYRPPQFEVAPVPGVRVTFDMEYHVEGTYTVGVGHSVIPGESLVTVARGPDIDLIVSLMENGIKEYDIRIRGNVVTTTVKAAVGLCGTIEQTFVTLPGSPNTTDASSVLSRVLFLYDEATASAADLMSLEAYGIAVVENGNLVLQNSGVTNLRWRYAGTVKATGYTSTGDTLADLNAMGNLATPLGAIVQEQGNQAIADQVLFIYNTFQPAGASGRAENPGHNSTAYWQAPWYVYIHEMGHNFGALHDRAYSSAADNNNVYRYGFVWTHPLTVTGSAGTTTTQVGYGTMMSFWGLEHIQPYFSNPLVNITYVGNFDTTQEYIETRSIGVAVGQPKAADNARGLREAAVPMAAYRVVTGPPPSTVAPVVAPPPAAATPERPSSQGGDLSLWFYAAIAGIGLLRRRLSKP